MNDGGGLFLTLMFLPADAAPANTTGPANVHDLYAGGAFLPYPGVTPDLNTMSPTGERARARGGDDKLRE